MGAQRARYFYGTGEHTLSSVTRNSDGEIMFLVHPVDENKQRRVGHPAQYVRVSDLPQPETFKVCGGFGLNPKDYGSLLARQDAIERAAVQHLDTGLPAWKPINARQEPGGGSGGGGEQQDGQEQQQQDAGDQDGKQEQEQDNGSGQEQQEQQQQGSGEGGSGDPLRDEIQRMIDTSILAHNEGDPHGAVDVDEVTRLIDAATKHLRPVVTEIHLPDREPVQIEDVTHEAFDRILPMVNAGLHVMMVGPAGTGKSTIGEQIAKALGLAFYTMSVDQTMFRDSLFGFVNVHGDYVGTDLRNAYEHGGVFVLDEIDNGTASVLGGLNQLLANGGCGFPDRFVRKHADFRMVATANTFGTGPDAQYVGRSQLDAATLDRFVNVSVPVDEAMEAKIAHSLWANADEVARWIAKVRGVRQMVSEYGLREVVSPRATYHGVTLLRAGLAWQDVIEAALAKGMSKDVRAKVGL